MRNKGQDYSSLDGGLGLPFGEAGWTKRLARRLDLDLTIRPRGRPSKRTTSRKANK